MTMAVLIAPLIMLGAYAFGVCMFAIASFWFGDD